MKYFDPTGVKKHNETRSPHPLMISLAGKAVGILSNVWPSYEDMIVRFREQLIEKYKVSKIHYYPIPRTFSAPDELLEKVVNECDVAIVGLGN